MWAQAYTIYSASFKFGCIIFKIRTKSHLFPTSINTSPLDALLEIEDTLGSYPSSPPSPDCDGYANISRKIRVPNELAKERIGQLVAEIDVEPGANAEGAMTETRGLEEAGNTFAQTRPYIKPYPNLFWKPKPTIKFMYVDMLIRTHIVYIQDYYYFFFLKKRPMKKVKGALRVLVKREINRVVHLSLIICQPAVGKAFLLIYS